jgi:effector-binding domain-containing protein
MTDLIPIGRFSRMTRLSIKALRFYDEQGLLRPVHVDPSSGYRYYGRVQANRAEAIRILRSTGMPVDEIREVLAEDDPDRTGKRLAVHRERLLERLAEQERMLRFLERLIERGEGVMPYQVTVKKVEPQQVAALRLHTNISAVAADVQRGFGTLIEAITGAGAAPSGIPFIVFHDVIDEQTAGDIEICIPVPPGTAFPDGPARATEIPGGPVASTIHRGPYAEISPAYHYLTGWIAEQSHQHAGPPREIYLNDPQSVTQDELLTEVQFPISYE